MENRFHLAIPAGDLDKAIKFYCDVLGCERGNAEFKYPCLLYTSPSPRDRQKSRMPSSA